MENICSIFDKFKYSSEIDYWKKNNFAWHFFKLDLLFFLYLSSNIHFFLWVRDKQEGKMEETA